MVSTPKSTASGPAPSVELLTDLKQENTELLGDNKELERLVAEARQLCESAEAFRNRPQSEASQCDADRLLADLGNLRRRADACTSRQASHINSCQNSRPTSAGSSRPGGCSGWASRPSSSGGLWKKPASRPISAKSRCDGVQTPVGTPSCTLVRELTVEIDRSQGESLGMKIRAAGAVLEVTKVKDEGLVAGWNAKNPSTAVCRGDKVIEVNGKRGNADDLLKECTQEVPLRLLVRRPQVRNLNLEASPTSPGGASTLCGSP